MKNIEILQSKGIQFDNGLSIDEIKQIEQLYEIVFPEELKSLYMSFLPISNGFYLWRDFSSSNIQSIRNMIEMPFKEMENEINDIEWSENWGEEPLGYERNEKIRQKLKTAPKLIPIYFHRYIASGNLECSPVFSVHGTDIIYYGENLNQYLEIEFAGRPYEDIDYKQIHQIPFWSEII